MVASADYEDRINALVCIDSTVSGCGSPANDVNTELVYNNKLALGNSTTMLDAVKMRISTLQIINISNILDRVVSGTDVDIEKDKDLAGPPDSGASVLTSGE